jgi:hypothetical protein
VSLRLHRPSNVQDLERRLETALAHYLVFRPHQGLHGATPAEVLLGRRTRVRQGRVPSLRTRRRGAPRLALLRRLPRSSEPALPRPRQDRVATEVRPPAHRRAALSHLRAGSACATAAAGRPAPAGPISPPTQPGRSPPKPDPARLPLPLPAYPRARGHGPGGRRGVRHRLHARRLPVLPGGHGRLSRSAANCAIDLRA